MFQIAASFLRSSKLFRSQRNSTILELVFILPRIKILLNPT